MPNYCPDCGARWTDGHRCGPGYYTITADDVGKRFLLAFGKNWPLSDVMGHIQRGDVGKRIYLVRNNGDDRDLLQVENNTQRDVRLAAG